MKATNIFYGKVELVTGETREFYVYQATALDALNVILNEISFTAPAQWIPDELRNSKKNAIHEVKIRLVAIGVSNESDACITEIATGLK